MNRHPTYVERPWAVFTLLVGISLLAGILSARAGPNYITTVENTPNLLGYWRFSPGSQANSEVNGYTGSFMGSAAVGPANSGPLITGDSSNSAVLLDGATSAFVNTSLTGQIDQQGSILAWFYLVQLPSDAGRVFYIAGESQVADDLDLQIDSDNKIKFFTEGAASTVDPTALTSADLNQWHMVAATFTASARRSIYLDGQLAATSVPDGHSLNNSSFSIGASTLFGNRFLNGRLDEVAIFNRELSAAEVANIYASAGSTPPVITSPLVGTGTVGLPFTYQFTANGATSLGVSNLPPGLTFNTSLGAITGLPTTAGIFPVGLRASNAAGTTTATLTITVQPAPSGLVIVSSTAATGRTGRPFSFQLRAKGGSSATRFAVENALPPGFNLDSSTGFISGTPASDGNSSLAVSAIDGTTITRGTVQLTFTSDPTVPIITSPATAILTPGQLFTYPITADANGTFGYIGSDGIVHQAPSPSCAGLPAGLCFDGNHTISGTFNPPFGSDRKSLTRPDQTGGIITNVQLFAANPPNGGGILSQIFFREPSGAGNIATRLTVGTGENVLIGGFIIEGNAPKKVVIRARGPSLTQFGVPNALADPVLDLNAQAGPLSSNDDWRDNPGQANQIIETQLQPSDDREAAILAYLNPGPYTAVVRGKNNSTGNALVEVYDLGTAILADTSSSRLANIATRGTVLGGDSVMIGGFIIRRADTRMVVRAIGPSLSAFGISGALPDPTLELKNANGVTLIGNDDWESDPMQAAEIQQRLLAPSNPRESALVTTLQPGQYTAIVSGKGGATGVAVVEGYALSNP